MTNAKPNKSTVVQFILYAIIGVAANALGYLVFLVMTYYSLEPKIAATCLYLFCATLSFFGNKRITFNEKGHFSAVFFRYLLAYFTGYLINIMMLVVLTDHLGCPYYLIQAIAIITVAGFLFVSLKLFVFPIRKLS